MEGGVGVLSTNTEHLAGQSALWAESAAGPKCPGPPSPPRPRKSSPARHARGLPCTRAWFCDQGSWGSHRQALVVTQGNPSACPKHLLLPQLRRSPIKKVRKSLALDIVDEDMKLMMSTLPKALPLVRGLGEKPSCEATCYSPPELQEAGGMESPWGPSPLEPFSLERTLEVESGDSRAGLPRAGLSGEGAAGHHPPGFSPDSPACVFHRKVYLARVALLEPV